MPRKERITVSLSQGSARFLRAFRAKVHSPSMSALFERIVADLQNRVEMEQLEKKIAAYYDGLADSGVQEDSVWGALGEATLVSQVGEEEHQRQLTGAVR
jgi:hypothetical protein